MLRIYERIIPKLDDDGTYRCFYYDVRNGQKKPGYDPDRTNLGSYLISVIKWGIKSYDYREKKAQKQLQYNEELDNYDSAVLDEEIHDLNLKVLSISNDSTNQSIRKLHAWLQLSKDN